MALWLFKTEPDCYAYADLERDGRTLWDGVANPLALKHLRACAAGDRAFVYHTGKEKAVIGVAEITGPAVPDPTADDPRLVCVPVAAVARLANPVTLAAVKADPAFAGWELVTQARLSVMPVSADLWARIEWMAGGEMTAVKMPKPQKARGAKK